ncbi:MAG: hypothetical protein J7L34_06270 [Thermotogaceae bacterium]|nr:hypothetical protein [Thermotogaceae bacterium]
MMKKFLIVAALVVSMLIFAAGYRGCAERPQTDDRPYLVRNITDESITLSGVKVESIEELDGRRMAVIETEEGKVMVIIPYKLSRYYDVTLESGSEITIEGKKVVVNGETFILPEKITIGENTYDVMPGFGNAAWERENFQGRYGRNMAQAGNQAVNKEARGRAKPSTRRGSANKGRSANQRNFNGQRCIYQNR